MSLVTSVHSSSFASRGISNDSPAFDQMSFFRESLTRVAQGVDEVDVIIHLYTQTLQNELSVDEQKEFEGWLNDLGVPYLRLLDSEKLFGSFIAFSQSLSCHRTIDLQCSQSTKTPLLKRNSLQKAFRVFVKQVVDCSVLIPLARALNDIDHAKAILHMYQATLQNLLTMDEKRLFESWLIASALYLGGKACDYDFLLNDLASFINKDSPLGSAVSQQKIVFLKQSLFQSKFLVFLQGVTDLVSSYRRQTPIDQPPIAFRKVAILYPGFCGRGHRTSAEAISQFFTKKGIGVAIIDTDVIELPYAPKIIEGYTNAQLYAEVRQEEGRDEKWERLKAELDSRYRLDNRRAMKDIREILVAEQVDHIFCIAHHQPHFSSLGFQLGIGITFVHTDREFSRLLVPLVALQKKLTTNVISFSVVDTSESFFKQLLHNPTNREIIDLPVSVRRHFVTMGLPVRASFQPSTYGEMRRIREKAGIPINALVITACFGQNCTKREMEEFLQKVETEYQLSLETVVVHVLCGTNRSLIKLVLQKGKDSKNIVFSPLGFLSEYEMAQQFKIADVVFTKPGGSITSELIQMRKKVLYVLATDSAWEESNASLLRSSGLGQEYFKETPLQLQIQELLEKPISLKNLPEPWNVQLGEYIRACERAHRFMLSFVQSKLALRIPHEKMLEIARTIELFLNNNRSTTGRFLSRHDANIFRSVEKDTHRNIVVIYLKERGVPEIHAGHTKTSSLALLYNPDHPRLCVETRLKDTFAEKLYKERRKEVEIQATLHMQAATRLVLPIAVTGHIKRKTGLFKEHLIYELSARGSLADVLEKGNLTEQQKMKIAISVLQSLAELHGFLYVHQNIHVGNILIAQDYTATLGDFLRTESFQDIEFHGKPVTIEPDVAALNEAISKDLFALGVCLYQLIHQKDVVTKTAETRLQILLQKSIFTGPELLEFAVYNLLSIDTVKRKTAAFWVEQLLMVSAFS